MSRHVFPVVWLGSARPYAIVGEIETLLGRQLVRALDLADHVPPGTEEVGVDMVTINDARLGMIVIKDCIQDPRPKHRRAKLVPCVLRIEITASLVD